MCVCSTGKRKKMNSFGYWAPLARTGDPIFLQRLLIKLVWRTGLARTQLPGFGCYCSEKNPPKPSFFSIPVSTSASHKTSAGIAGLQGS